MIKNIFIDLFIALSLTACAQKKISQLTPSAPEPISIEGFDFVQTPRLCQKVIPYIYAEKILEICNGQTYEFDLLRKKERRISYQDGQIFTAAMVSDQLYLYSSNTDQIKEAFLQSDKNDPTQLSDIYLANLITFDISRMPNSKAYKGLPQFDLSEQKMTYIQIDGEFSKIMTTSIPFGNEIELYRTKNSITDLVQLNKEVGLFWLEESDSGTLLKKRLNNKITTELEFKKAETSLLLAKSNSGEVLGILRKDLSSKNTNLVIKKPQRNCELSLNLGSTNISWMALSDARPFQIWAIQEGALLRKELNEVDSACLLTKKPAK